MSRIVQSREEADLLNTERALNRQFHGRYSNLLSTHVQNVCGATKYADTPICTTDGHISWAEKSVTEHFGAGFFVIKIRLAIDIHQTDA